MKKDVKAWAIKLRGRSFWLNAHSIPWMFSNKKRAELHAMNIKQSDGIPAEPIRVRVRIEEIE